MRWLLLVSMMSSSLALAQAPAPPERDDTPATETTLLDDRSALRPPDEPLPEKIVEPPPPEAAPTVSIRTDRSSGDVVEEYRQNGRIYMVKVRPLKGPPYSLLDTNGDGRLDEADGEGPVRPVYWTIYEWN